MRVHFLDSVSFNDNETGVLCSYARGDVADVNDFNAKDLIKGGYAKAADEKKSETASSKAKLETANAAPKNK